MRVRIGESYYVLVQEVLAGRGDSRRNGTVMKSTARIFVLLNATQPLRALAEAILVTPTLVKVSPEPELPIIGNLSDEEEGLHALGLPQKDTA